MVFSFNIAHRFRLRVAKPDSLLMSQYQERVCLCIVVLRIRLNVWVFTRGSRGCRTLIRNNARNNECFVLPSPPSSSF